jgi:anti-anti-sigma regulatory factor
MSENTPVMSHEPRPGIDERIDDTAPVDDGAWRLPASLTIADVGELRLQWNEWLADDAPVTIDGIAVEIVDGAGMQLLAALFTEAARRRLPVLWSGHAPVIDQAAAELGLDGLLGLAGPKTRIMEEQA